MFGQIFLIHGNRRRTASARPASARAPGCVLLMFAFGLVAAPAQESLRSRLDAPVLFIQRHAYMAPHIYDDYYMWRPGGGIYVIENPSAPEEERQIRAVIDPGTPESLGFGVYRDPSLSWDAKKVVFAFKGEENGSTSIYEIGLDGKGLRRLTDPEQACTTPMPERAFGQGRHDISPCYLPDGRIVFTSTRLGGRVPCFNSEVDTLHVMDADGDNVRAISVNNVNEFDPAVLPDGRILYGRWEYVDKTALYMQSLWTVHPDGSQETALFANNLAKPTALLQARPVPGSHLIVAALTPHNGQAVGAIAMIDPHRGKNNLDAIFNFTPEHPTEMDQGLMRGPSHPWPLSEDLVLISNNGETPHAVLELVHRSGRREPFHSEPDIGCFSAMLVKPRPVPPVLSSSREDSAVTGRFLVQDIYQGLEGVRRGEVGFLRVIEETARVSGIPDGGRWWNQAFLVSWQGAYTIKNFLGTVPVRPDGSAYFEAPSGRALYFQALDREGRMLQSMRTFVQAVPGTSRSCVGCHEYKSGAPELGVLPLAQRGEPETIRPEAWGSGFIDYPTRIQPILDRNCVSCHGGAKGIAGGIDLSGGWTWAFNISYETLLKNTLAGFLNCVNEAVRTAEVLPPRTHGSGAAPLSDLLLGGHEGRIPDLTEDERALLFAWMDGNSNYYGTWDWSEQATCNAILLAGQRLSEAMQRANCTQCHSARVGDDWINLQTPEWSRILRAPLAEGKEGFGLGWCRDRKGRDVRDLVQSPAQPPDVFNPRQVSAPDRSGDPFIRFASIADEDYQAMLHIILKGREEALARPRVDMPGADIIPGVTRQMVPLPLPAELPGLYARTESDAVVALEWERSACTIGLTFEIHRSDDPDFVPDKETLLAETVWFQHLDRAAPPGVQHYALVLKSGRESTPAVRGFVRVPVAPVAPVPAAVVGAALPGEIQLSWRASENGWLRFNVYRAIAGSPPFEQINDEPVRVGFYIDNEVEEETTYEYRLTSVNRRGEESAAGEPLAITALPERREAVFAALFQPETMAMLDGELLAGGLTEPARMDGGILDLRDGGHAVFPTRPEFDLRSRFTVACRVKLSSTDQRPVLISYGRWREAGWFLQKYGNTWRWHAGGATCDGGKAVAGEWTHLVAVFDGRHLKLYQDGAEVRSVASHVNRATWTQELMIGQYIGGRADEFQLLGEVADVQIYHRALKPEEVRSLFETAGGASGDDNPE